ncbi:uncharacterized protein LOC141623417 [Silene latifolia]|uniref:uncharacterized protein LOC141623417 n=1 Tax=Silene latifolia TaxID=37657 RepID=UPI003D76F152
MRIISKCVANRLARVMSSLTGEFQNAFIPGRLISDNILLAHEGVHEINRHKSGKYGRFAFKADMSKAYDRIRWGFLAKVMSKFGFPERLINLIMNCVMTVSYEILLNGSPLNTFSPKCGLRQGDPLSPYLFILCMEVLSGMVIQAQNRGLLKGIQLCKQVTPLTHLFFADDVVFFLQDTGDSAKQLKNVLDAYCRASGQRINDAKSGVQFSPSMRLSQVQVCLKVFNIRNNKGIGKYLGIPTEFQGSKRDFFMALTDCVMKRISSWNGIFLSSAGRLTLISSVLSNLSNYFLSVFKISVSVANKINSLLSHFWWAGCKSGKGTHWCSRNFLSLPKSAGGLGMRNIECLNQALLAKQAWRIVSGQESLFCKVFRAKLFGRQGMNADLEYKRSGNVSWGMRSLRYGLDLLAHNVAWKPGTRSSLNVWTTRWVNGEMPEPSAEALQLENVDLKDLTIRDIHHVNGGWDEQRIKYLLHEGVVDHILAMPVCASQIHDCIYWKHTTNGEYSVKSGYGVAFTHFMEKHASNKDKTRMSANSVRFCQKVLWKLQVPQKWKVFLWRLISDSLLVGSSLAKRGFQADPFCRMCATENGCMESRAHLFRDCSVAQRIWACLDLGIRVNCAPSMDIGDWIINWMSFLGKSEGAATSLIKYLGTLWCLWVVRNRVVFQEATFHPQMFYGIWRSTVDIVLKAREEGDNIRGVDRVVGGTSNCSPIEPGDGQPFYVVGAASSCASIKVMVDAGWKSVKEAAIGWVATAEDGTILFSKSIKIKAQSAMQSRSSRSEGCVDLGKGLRDSTFRRFYGLS